MSGEKKFTVQLSDKELKLIRYWREACHLYNDLCPLHCVEGGTELCHKVIEAVTSGEGKARSGHET